MPASYVMVCLDSIAACMQATFADSMSLVIIFTAGFAHVLMYIIGPDC